MEAGESIRKKLYGESADTIDSLRALVAEQQQQIAALLQQIRDEQAKTNAAVIAGNQQRERADKAEAVEEPFRIGLGINRYRPCPRCLADSGMGLVCPGRAIRVQCGVCHFEGPALKYTDDQISWRLDKWAFDAWNDLPREQEQLAELKQRAEAAEAKLTAAKRDTERLDWLEGELQREGDALLRCSIPILFRRNQLITRAAIDEAMKLAEFVALPEKEKHA